MSTRFLKYQLLDDAAPSHDYRAGDLLTIDRKRHPREGEYVLAAPWGDLRQIRLYRYGEARAKGNPLFFPATVPDGAQYGAFEDMGDVHIIGMVCGRVRYTPRRIPDRAPKYHGEARLIGPTKNPYRNERGKRGNRR